MIDKFISNDIINKKFKVDIMSNIDILMASYNSEKYIESQIDSILNQTYNDYHIYINDDISTDNTLNILQNYKKQYNNIFSISQNSKRQGIKENFSTLMDKSNADYIMFSDHDDVWFDNKIEITYKEMTALEKKYSATTPLLVFTDKTVTDSSLNIINQSHNKSEKLNTKNISFNRLLMGNVVSGCTIMINKVLKEICGHINKNAIMHDYWLALTAAAFGHICYIDKPTMYYRQHGSNTLGAKSYSLKFAMQKLKEGRKNMQQAVFQNIMQAECFLNQYENILNSNQKKILKEFISLKNKRNIYFIDSIIKNHFYKSGFIRNAGLFFAFL